MKNLATFLFVILSVSFSFAQDSITVVKTVNISTIDTLELDLDANIVEFIDIVSDVARIETTISANSKHLQQLSKAGRYSLAVSTVKEGVNVTTQVTNKTAKREKTITIDGTDLEETYKIKVYIPNGYPVKIIKS